MSAAENARQRAARIDVIKAAARRMQDTDDDFWIVLGKFLKANALVLEVAPSRERVHAYEIAEAYLRNEDRLKRFPNH